MKNIGLSHNTEIQIELSSSIIAVNTNRQNGGNLQCNHNIEVPPFHIGKCKRSYTLQISPHAIQNLAVRTRPLTDRFLHRWRYRYTIIHQKLHSLSHSPYHR